jgi:hypothetical protein
VCLLVKQRYGKERTKTWKGCQEGTLDREFREWETRGLAPDDAFLIEEIIDDFDAIAHLDLRLF